VNVSIKIDLTEPFCSDHWDPIHSIEDNHEREGTSFPRLEHPIVV
jgi:hypothetical protein